MIAATLHGPNYWAQNHDESSIEIFENIGDAIEALLDRNAANGKRQCAMATLDGEEEACYFPTFGLGHRFECYALSGDASMDCDEGTVMEALTAVHTGVRDWTLELNERDGETIVVVSAS